MTEGNERAKKRFTRNKQCAINRINDPIEHLLQCRHLLRQGYYGQISLFNGLPNSGFSLLIGNGHGNI